MIVSTVSLRALCKARACKGSQSLITGPVSATSRSGSERAPPQHMRQLCGANNWYERLQDSQLAEMFGVHISGIVAGIATVPAALAFFGRRALPLPVELVLCHIAAAGFTVAAASSSLLANHTTWLLGKTSRGLIRPWSLALFWPYHAGLRAKLAIQRRVSTEPSWNQITPNYFLGAWPSEEALVPTVKPAVLDVTCELPLQVVPPAYLCLPVWDTHGPLPHQIEEGVQWAAQQRAAGRQVLIHCAHGHGRSATVLCAILIAGGQASGIAEAEAILKAERPRVRLNYRQRAALKGWLAGREAALVKQQ